MADLLPYLALLSGAVSLAVAVWLWRRLFG
jgi:hypothetical protein